jgi:hypothetical protein
MTDCATPKMRFETEAALALEAVFDGGPAPPLPDPYSIS